MKQPKEVNMINGRGVTTNQRRYLLTEKSNYGREQ